MYIIRYERDRCIGAGACEATNPDHFKMDTDGKAILLGGNLKENETFEKEISESQKNMAEIAVMGCPSKCIKLLRKDTREEIQV